MPELTEQHIVNWVSKHFDYHLKPNGELIIPNPFYHNDKPKLGINTQLGKIDKKGKPVPVGMMHDWRTNLYDMGFINFVKKYKNIEYNEAVKEIFGNDVVLRPQSKNRPQQIPAKPVELIKLPQGSKPLINDEGLASSIVRSYLHNRCVTDSDIEKYKIHYNSSSVVFPYYEFDELCFWQSRDILNKKFLFPNMSKHGVGKTEFIYGFDLLSDEDTIIVVEAIIGSISVGKACTASGGATLESKQCRKLKFLNPSRIILAPDLDFAGISSIFHNNNLLSQYCEVWYALPDVDMIYDGNKLKDWNEYDKLMGGHTKNSPCYDYIEKNAKPLTTKNIIYLHKLAESLKGRKTKILE